MFRFNTILDAIKQHADSAGHQLAVADERCSLSFAQLDELSSAAAHLLHRHTRAGEAIAVIADCSITSVLAPVAVMKAACVYVPIYAQWPQHQIAAICRDACIRTAIADDSLCRLLPPEVTAIPISQITSITAPTVGNLPLPTPNHLALIVYTSGSSGQPKGCMLTHRNLAAQA
ncbi:MAG: AMP-binding protein, partial [Muribaculaceae bacterium]